MRQNGPSERSCLKAPIFIERGRDLLKEQSVEMFSDEENIEESGEIE